MKSIFLLFITLVFSINSYAECQNKNTLIHKGFTKQEIDTYQQRHCQKSNKKQWRVIPAEPKMKFIRGGVFIMGSPANEERRLFSSVLAAGAVSTEHQHKVAVNDFWIGKTEVTVREYQLCVKEKVCRPPEWLEKNNNKNIYTGNDNTYKKLGKSLIGGNYPIVGVSWHDASNYVRWLKNKTKKNYRLPTEAEWEYVARRGTKTPFSWGDSIKNKANCSRCGTQWDGKGPSPVASFAPFKGVYDMHGNVSEWTCSKSIAYEKKSWETMCIETKDDDVFVLRGGSWYEHPISARSASRHGQFATSRSNFMGFRVAKGK